MAMRHGFPRLRDDQVGDDAYRVIPRLPAPTVLAFRAGEDVEKLAKSVVQSRIMIVDAAPGAGKTVDFPSGLVAGGVKLVVHASPSEHLTLASYKYVSSIKKDVAIVHVKEFTTDVEFPRSGLVFVNSSMLVAYMVYWRSKADTSRKVCLYLDEVHEPDAATATLRELKTSAPCVEQFLQSTATMGCGDAAKPYRPLVMKSKLEERTFTNVDPTKWATGDTGVPWSMQGLVGDFLIFEDRPDYAAALRKKFEDDGVATQVFTSSSDPEVFVAEKAKMEARYGKGFPVSAMVVDNSFRSGHTFTSIARIIDMGKVREMRPGPGGVPEVSYRDMYLCESVQGKARGARIPGRPCDYWRPAFELKPAQNSLAGYECDSAAMLFRLLGFKPPAYLQGVPTFEGPVPPKLLSILSGPEPVRRFYPKDRAGCVPWPGVAPVVPEVAEAPTLVAASTPGNSRPVSVVSSMASSNSTESFPVGGRDKMKGFSFVPDSYMVERLAAELATIGEGIGEQSRLSGLPFEESDDGYVSAGEGDFVERMIAVRKSFPVEKKGRIKKGPYYHVPGVETCGETALFPSGFDDLWGVIKVFSPEEYGSTLSGKFRLQIIRILLSAYNGAVALERAARMVLESASGLSDRVGIGAEAVDVWVGVVRDAFVRAGVRKNSAFKYLEACVGFRGCAVVSEMDELERAFSRDLFGMLSVETVPPDIGLFKQQQLDQSGAGWADMTGDYRVDWRAKGVRERIAYKLLGKPPTASVLFEGPKQSVLGRGW
jgi:hypothetical protein